jgi:hypothetical protein
MAKVLGVSVRTIGRVLARMKARPIWITAKKRMLAKLKALWAEVQRRKHARR